MYEKNIATGEKDSERVEFAIRIPASDDKSRITYLPVDSKFPMEDYVRLCTAADHADPDAVKAARKALEDRVLSEAKMIKKYINVPNTTPFAIMYLATEGLYAEIVSSSSGILEKIQNECNVMVAGPSTITALLNSLSMGFKTVAINEKANEVRVLLGAAKAQYENFSVILEKAKKKIDDAGKTLDDAQKRNTIIRKKLRTVEDLEQLEAASVLGLSDNNFTDDAE
jgi:DNA recombination protein RmuC